MTLSRSETFALCRKAARGAGYDWGMAEEIGVACVYLCEQGINPTDHLVDYLSLGNCTTLRVAAWPPKQSGTCPFSLGCSLVDHLACLENREYENVYAPIFLASFVSRVVDQNVRLIWNDAVIDLINGNLSYQGEILATKQCNVTVQAIDNEEISTKSTPKFPLSEHRMLLKFSANTYVPDSEESRARGAG